MIGSSMLNRRGRTEQVAEQAWQQLVARVAAAGDTAVSATRSSRLADTLGARVAAVTDEARYRANAALDALAGRRPATPWSWIAGATLIGVAIGIVAGAFGGATARARADKASTDTNDRVEFVDVDRPSAPVSLDR
jgi:hypothetical protein